VEVDDDTPLLWVIRDAIGLTGTKFGCGLAQCGACTVHVNGTALRSCSYPIAALPEGAEVTTIEGLGQPDTLHPVQQAWLDEQVPQCGYCQSGQLMAAAALLQRTPDPSDEDIRGLTNLCRCATYPRIRKALRRAAQLQA
ncbi:MAG: (2Fe-2S)-binding protein, partial [SAR324 cluster bacterium]|nr:(2Fe-2S)-binding protein [SAR324 cluster bacterium]